VRQHIWWRGKDIVRRPGCKAYTPEDAGFSKCKSPPCCTKQMKGICSRYLSFFAFVLAKIGWSMSSGSQNMIGIGAKGVNSDGHQNSFRSSSRDCCWLVSRSLPLRLEGAGTKSKNLPYLLVVSRVMLDRRDLEASG
jgi:hypothetical protein